jgi:hypothetical protein
MGISDRQTQALIRSLQALLWLSMYVQKLTGYFGCFKRRAVYSKALVEWA